MSPRRQCDDRGLCISGPPRAVPSTIEASTGANETLVDLAQLTSDLEALAAEAAAAVAAAPDVAALDALEVEVLGKKGRLTGVLRGIGGLAAEDRPTVGAVANTVRGGIEAALAARRVVLAEGELQAR